MNWLQELFEERLADVFCGHIHCTTCGGQKLWSTVLKTLNSECLRQGLAPQDRDDVLIAGLRALAPSAHTQRDWGAAVVAILSRTRGWRRLGTFDGTWVGKILEERDRIDAEAREGRRQHEEFVSPEATLRRREEKRRQRHEAHALRLQRQREQSIRWHAQQQQQQQQLRPADYVLYRDHIGWVITTAGDYQLLQRIYRAMNAKTWGEFFDALPGKERNRLLHLHADLFGPDLIKRPAASLDPDDELYSRDSPFDADQLPGFNEGDYPPWPAEDSQISDNVCREAYRRFGKRESGFIHTFSHIRDDQLVELQAWLQSMGHTVARRDHPGTGSA